jgi:hypothetical protein
VLEERGSSLEEFLSFLGSVSSDSNRLTLVTAHLQSGKYQRKFNAAQGLRRSRHCKVNKSDKPGAKA